MDKFTNIHTVTLSAEQAKWWKEVCTDLGIEVKFHSDPNSFELAKKGQMAVETICSNEDRRTAWTLFLEQHKLSANQMPTLTLGN